MNKSSIIKSLKYFILFVAYPYWVVVQNISFYFYLYFLRQANIGRLKMFSINSPLSGFAIAFMAAAVISVLGAIYNFGGDNALFSLKVLPNYLYWGILIITLGNIVFKVVDISFISKYITIGVILTIINFHFLSGLLGFIPFYSGTSKNAFAFINILFTPIATSYIHTKYRNNYLTILCIILFTLSGFLSGSRSASLLVLSGCMLAWVIESWFKITMVLYLILMVYLIAPTVLETPGVKKLILNLNPRTYELIYESDKTFAEDRSYLTRVAMIEKGMNIFNEYPIIGVGIGNFSNVTFHIDFDFEGAEFIERLSDELESKTNPHNSYISLLAEGGLVLILPALLLMFYPILFLIINFNKIPANMKAYFIGIIFMDMHAWVIAGMINIYGWVLIGIVNSYIIHRKSIST